MHAWVGKPAPGPTLPPVPVLVSPPEPVLPPVPALPVTELPPVPVAPLPSCTKQGSDGEQQRRKDKKAPLRKEKRTARE